MESRSFIRLQGKLSPPSEAIPQQYKIATWTVRNAEHTREGAPRHQLPALSSIPHQSPASKHVADGGSSSARAQSIAASCGTHQQTRVHGLPRVLAELQICFCRHRGLHRLRSWPIAWPIQRRQKSVKDFGAQATRSAFSTATTSIASCVIAPATGGK